MSFEKYTLDGQDPKVVEKIYGKIIDMLTTGESINYISVQKKPAVTLLPDSITVSNRRIFLCEFTKLGLATNFEIFSWHDIKDISFKEEIFGSKVTVIPFTGENLTVDYIPKIQARKLYQLIKESLDQIQKDKVHKEKIVIENRPVFETPQPIVPVEKEPVPVVAKMVEEPVRIFDAEEEELTLKLTRLKNLFDKQLISQAEYESKKADILKDL